MEKAGIVLERAERGIYALIWLNKEDGTRLKVGCDYTGKNEED